jgi:hypothetical protein
MAPTGYRFVEKVGVAKFWGCDLVGLGMLYLYTEYEFLVE